MKLEMPKLKKEKGLAVIGFLIMAIVGFFVVGILLGHLVSVLSDMREAETDANAQAIINDTLTGIGDQADWFSTYNALVAAVVIMGFVSLIIGAVSAFKLGGFGGGA